MTKIMCYNWYNLIGFYTFNIKLVLIMDGKQRIYYALGQFAYVIAKADGEIQREEKDKLHKITLEATSNHNIDFDFSEIIFSVLEKENQDSNTVYEAAVKNIHAVKHFFDKDMRADFMAALEKIADAFPPYSMEEELCIEKIRKEVREL